MANTKENSYIKFAFARWQNRSCRRAEPWECFL